MFGHEGSLSRHEKGELGRLADELYKRVTGGGITKANVLGVLPSDEFDGRHFCAENVVAAMERKYEDILGQYFG